MSTPAAPRAGTDQRRTPRIDARRVLAGGLTLPLLLAFAVAVSLTVGAGSFHGGDVSALLASRGDRTAIGIIVGAAVAMAGTAMQGITRNPLADPGILGINAGSALAVVIGITWWGVSNLLGYVLLSLVGAAVAAVAVMALATFGARALGQASQSGPLTLALSGMVFTAGTSSIAQAVLVSHGKSLDTYRFWQVGSVAGRDLGDLVPAVPFLLIGFLVLLASGRRLNVLAMGDSVAAGLGERPGRLRLVIGGAGVMLAAAATGIAGPIAFVGLVAPHVLRPLIGTSYRVLVPSAGVLGACIVVLADTLGRIVSPPGEVQVGIMTAVLGCPALLWVVARMRSL